MPTQAEIYAQQRQQAQPQAQPMTMAQRYAQSRAAPASAPTQPVDDTRSLANRSARRGLQDILATPAALVGTLPVAAHAGMMLAGGGTESFTEGMYKDEYRDLYRRAQDETLPLEQQVAADEALAQLGQAGLRGGVQLGLDAYNWGGRVAGTQNNPDGSVPLDEEIGGTVLSSILTLPVAPVKALSLGSKGATLAARAAIKTAEFATPLTVVSRGASASEMAIAAGINTAVGVGIDQASRHLMGDETLFTRKDVPDEIDPMGLPGYGVEIAATGTLAAGVAAGSMGLAAILRPGKAVAALNQAGNAVVHGRPPLGPLSSDKLRQVPGDILAPLADDKAIVRRALDRTNVPNAQEIDDTHHTLTGASQTDQMRRAFEFGDFGDGITAPPARTWKQTFAALPDDVKTLARETYEAMNERGRRKNGAAPQLTRFTDADLFARERRGLSNPVVRQVIQGYDEIMQAVALKRYKSGMTDFAQYSIETNSIGSKGGVFMKNATPRKPWLTRVTDKVTQRGSVTPDTREAKKPFDEVLDEYLGEQLREINHNTARRLVLNALAGRQQGSKNVIVRRLGKKDKAQGVGTPINVRENGRNVKYDIGDKRLYNAMLFRPRYTVPIARQMKQAVQWGTTGQGNPLFAPISALNDMGAGLLGARVDKQVSGAFDQALKESLASMDLSEKNANRIRIALAAPVRLGDLPWATIEGLYQGFKGRWLEQAAIRVRQLAEQSGNPIDMQRAQKALATYYDSKYARMQEAGYAPNAFVNDYDGAEKAMSRIIGGAVSNNRLVKGYTNLLETIRETYRMAAFTRNYEYNAKLKGRPLNAKETREVANQVRELGGDISNKSSSQIVNGIVSVVPYGNTILQSAAHMLHHMFTNPAAWSTMSGLVAMRYLADHSMSPEAREYVETQIPAYERTDTIFMETPHERGTFDPATMLERIPLAPEIGMISSLLYMGLDAMLAGAGLTDDAPSIGRSPVQARVGAAIGELVGFSTPPIANIIAAVAGYGPIDVTAALDERALFRLHRADGSHEDFRGYDLNDGAISDRVANILGATLGTFGRTMADSLETLLDHPTGTMTGEAWREAGDVTLHDAVERQTAGQWLTDATKALPRSTPAANATYELDRSLEDAARYSRELIPNIDGVEDADLYAGESFQVLSEYLNDPALVDQAITLHQYLLGPYHQQDMDEIGQLKIRQHRIRGRDASQEGYNVEDRNKALNGINAELHERYMRVLTNFDYLRNDMIQMTGDPEWSIEKFMRAARDDMDR